MAKAWLEESGHVLFECPGCGSLHAVNTKPDSERPRWEWNGSLDAPTFTPSLLVRSGHFCAGPQPPNCEACNHVAQKNGRALSPGCYVCHSFVTDGKIQFLQDCTHALAGQTVPLPDIED